MTTQFEIGKKYYSQYNSGVITIVKRTAKFVTFTEEINGQSMKSMIINGNGEISEGKTIETRKTVKVLNDSEYLSNGICSYYATNEVIETPEDEETKASEDEETVIDNKIQKIANDFNVTVAEVKEAMKMSADYRKNNEVHPSDNWTSPLEILSGECKSDIEISTKGYIKEFTQKNSKDGFLRGVVIIPVQNGTKEIKGIIKGKFIVERIDLYGGFYTTTHIPTGLEISDNYNKTAHKRGLSQQKQYVDNLIQNSVKFPNSLTEIDKLSEQERITLMKNIEKAYVV